MDKESNNLKESIVNLFEKMNSNITKYQISIESSLSHSHCRTQPINHSSAEQLSPCSCESSKRHRQLQSELYQSQSDLILKTSTLLQSEGNQILSKLLSFMSEYLQKLSEQISKQLLCSCRKKKLQQFQNLSHKVTFLRDQNHKFFKMIEQKNEQCQSLKKEIEIVKKDLSILTSQIETMPLPITLKSKCSQSERSREEISSRTISSNSSRVSQFKVAWPELIMPVNEGAHKGYFQPSPADRQSYFKDDKKCLKEKDSNESLNFGFKKSKIFCGSCLIN